MHLQLSSQIEHKADCHRREESWSLLLHHREITASRLSRAWTSSLYRCFFRCSWQGRVSQWCQGCASSLWQSLCPLSLAEAILVVDHWVWCHLSSRQYNKSHWSFVCHVVLIVKCVVIGEDYANMALILCKEMLCISLNITWRMTCIYNITYVSDI